ncbi:hypothetical protein JXD20_02905 [Candidatus Peregrinibacteria bacterium]|nr:hypothetical protein [Candidatus Peregrinibacteria bacterium]
MFKKLKQLFTSKAEKELLAAEKDFDKLLHTISEEEAGLDTLEKQVREEFEEIDDDVEKISRKVDEVVAQKIAIKIE